GKTEKNVIIATSTKDGVAKIKEILTRDYEIFKKGKGIAFTIPVSCVGGPASLQILSGMALGR
ncbi:MAG: hypothetical protein J5903_00675, partial [Clostridia bacterium]|nr:hypothetical protein [Clostridia bacterium]